MQLDANKKILNKIAVMVGDVSTKPTNNLFISSFCSVIVFIILTFQIIPYISVDAHHV